jgi:hypothetical protein
MESFVTLKVFDLRAREIKLLVSETMSPGKHAVSFDATNFASGVYFYTLTVKEKSGGNTSSKTNKMVLLK